MKHLILLLLLISLSFSITLIGSNFTYKYKCDSCIMEPLNPIVISQNVSVSFEDKCLKLKNTTPYLNIISLCKPKAVSQVYIRENKIISAGIITRIHILNTLLSNESNNTQTSVKHNSKTLRNSKAIIEYIKNNSLNIIFVFGLLIILIYYLKKTKD